MSCLILITRIKRSLVFCVHRISRSPLLSSLVWLLSLPQQASVPTRGHVMQPCMLEHNNKTYYTKWCPFLFYPTHVWPSSLSSICLIDHDDRKKLSTKKNSHNVLVLVMYCVFYFFKHLGKYIFLNADWIHLFHLVSSQLGDLSIFSPEYSTYQNIQFIHRVMNDTYTWLYLIHIVLYSLPMRTLRGEAYASFHTIHIYRTGLFIRTREKKKFFYSLSIKTEIV